jgi:hypothetical protein
VTTLSSQLERIRWFLQDTDTSANRTSVLTVAHQESLRRLARLSAFTQIAWLQALEGQAVYALPDQVVDIFHVLYDERVLRYATEKQLDRRFQAQWEDLRGEPIYYTTENQNPGTIRIIPAPVRTGSAVPVITPLSQDIRGNLLVFYCEDIAAQVDGSTDTLPGLLDFDDTLVWETVRQLAERETERQNLPVAQCAAQLLALWEQYLVLKSG